MNNSNTRNIIGIIFIVIGGLWILDNFNFDFIGMPFHRMIFSWHTAFIVAGAVIISKKCNSFWGYVLLGIGVIGWLKHVPYIPFVDELNFRNLWPLILLGFGLWLILNRNQKREGCKTDFQFQTSTGDPEQTKNYSAFSSNETQSYSLDTINETASFTSIKKIITSQNFKGGKVSAVFGAVELDFYNAKLAPGEHILDISAVFGGIDLRFPVDWKVVVNISPVFGGFEDKRYVNYEKIQNAESTLIIIGNVTFGGGDITN